MSFQLNPCPGLVDLPGVDLPIWLMFPHLESATMLVEVQHAKLISKSFERSGETGG